MGKQWAVLDRYRANVNAVSREGMSCLVLAAENGLADMVAFLVLGVDIWVKATTAVSVPYITPMSVVTMKHWCY
jgi:hypothetical protein